MIDCIERLHNSGTAAQKKCFCVDFLTTFLGSSIDRKCPTQVQFIAYVMHSCSCRCCCSVFGLVKCETYEITIGHNSFIPLTAFIYFLAF